MTQRPNPEEKAKPGEYAENLDDDATVLEGLARFESIVKRFDCEEIGLAARYPNRWVAFGADGVEKVGDSIEEVVASCTSRGLGNSDYVLRFLDPAALPEQLTPRTTAPSRRS